MLVFAATTATAQTPTVPPLVAGSSLSGVVQDASGAPLADVTVSHVGESATTRTDSLGRFALRDVPPGTHTALFRRIGYRSVEYRWLAKSGGGVQVAVTMTPVPRRLDRMVVEAPGASRRRGTSSIGGTVTDSAGHPVDSADVRLLGGGLSTVTDSAGRFEFQLLTAGSYIVRVRRAGLRSTNHVMQILDDDNRGISLKMFGLPPTAKSRDAAGASGYGIVDAGFDAFDRRQRAASGRPILGPADLVRADRASLDVLLQQFRDNPWTRTRRRGRVDEGAGSTDDGDCLVIDGRRAVYQPLRTFTSVNVQLVEVFWANALVDQAIVSQMEALAECRGSMDHHPSYFVLWTRSLR